MFAAVEQTPETERAADRKDRQTAFYVLGFGMVVLVAATAGVAVVLRQLFYIVYTFLN
jgi:hypothetical protein